MSFITQIIIFILFSLLFFSIGKIIIKDKLVKNNINFMFDYFIASLIGVGIIITYVFLISIMDIVNSFTLLIPFIGYLGLKYCKYDSIPLTALGVIFLIYTPIIYCTLYPPTHWDDISYHLPIAQSVLNNNGLIVNEFIRYPLFPMNVEMLFVFGLEFDVKLVQIFSSVMFFSIALGALGFVYEKTKSIYGGIIVFVFVISSELMISLSSMAYIDIYLTGFITGGILLLIYYFEKKQRVFFYLSAILFGLAVGTKYTAMIVCVIAGFTLLIYIFKNKGSIKDFFIYAGIVSVVGLPWYVRTYIHTGNPVWPFLNGIFGYSDMWSKGDYEGQFADFSVNGVEPTITNFLKIPVYLSSDYAGDISVFPLIWLGVLFYLVLNKMSKTDFILIAFVFFYTLAWFCSVNLVRYYVLILPILSIISALGFINIIKKVLSKPYYIVINIIVILVTLTIPFSYIGEKIKIEGLAPTSQIENETYLTNKLATYTATVKAASTGERVYGLLNENLYFYGNGNVIGDWFGKARYSEVLPYLNDEEYLKDKFKDMKIKYFLINKTRLTTSQVEYLNYEKYFETFYEDNNAIVYKIRY